MAEVEQAMGSLGGIYLGADSAGATGTAPAAIETKPAAEKVLTVETIAARVRQGKIRKVAVLSGAGLSTAAGIPDFRSPGSGLYSQMEKFKLPFPEAVFSLEYFMEDPKPFYTIAQSMLKQYLPTKAHYFIRLLQDKGILLRNFTQNVDNLEIDAGVKPELLVQAHGTIATSHCASCHAEVDHRLMIEHVKKGEPLMCTKCKNPCKPDIIMFGESLPVQFSQELDTMKQADLVIIIGTSLKVFPFSALIGMAGPTVPRIVVDRVVPDKIADSKEKRDVLMLGDAEDSATKLAAMFGLEKEFNKLLLEREALQKKYAELAKKEK